MTDLEAARWNDPDPSHPLSDTEPAVRVALQDEWQMTLGATMQRFEDLSEAERAEALEAARRRVSERSE